MASFTELHTIARSGALIPKITAAVSVQAEVVRTESGATTNHANRLTWAKQAFSDPEEMASKMVWAILAQNAGVASGSITGASDAAILTAVANAVDVFATGA